MTDVEAKLEGSSERSELEGAIKPSQEAPTEPRIVGFLCNWCSYAGADLAGVSRTQYPTNLKAIRVMCSGSVDPIYILEALLRGADGVLVAGCHPGDCHYIQGNYYTKYRIMILKRILNELGFDERRVRLEWVSASEGTKFANIISDFTMELKEMGPSPVTGDDPDLDQLEALYILRHVLEDFRINIFMTRMREWLDDGNVYGEKLKEQDVLDQIKDIVNDEFLRTRILFAVKEKALSVEELSEILNNPTNIILEHIVTLRDRDLIRMEGTKGDSPLYIAQPQEGGRMSTLPRWAQIERKSIAISLANLGDVDTETRNYIARELLLTLRCYNCERRRSNVCHFSVCIRGLMSGVVE
jgi:F420-non-reducing hydrogenase iron-sulfur subunit